MPLAERLLWGFASGLVIVLVKIIGPDQPEVQSFISGLARPDQIVAYFVFAGVTVALGILSGAFSTEPDRIELLIFCASAPAMVATYFAQERIVPRDEKANTAVIGEPTVFNAPRFRFVSQANAQEAAPSTECDEGSFVGRVVQNSVNRISGTNPLELPQFSVVVSSVTDLEEAKAIANNLAARFPQFRPSVGCRRPGNPHYPVIIGDRTDRSQAFELLGRYVQAAGQTPQPFISAYPFRVPIYTPKAK